MPRRKSTPRKNAACPSALRNFCFTLNNYSFAEELQVREFIDSKCRYGIVGKEVGEDKKTPHLQGYVELRKRTRFTTVRGVDCFRRAHIEPRRGTPTQASEYCKKEGNFYEVGHISLPGRRSDIHNLVEAAKDRKLTLKDLYEAHPVPMLKYHQHVQRMRLTYDRAETKFTPVDVQVYWGDAGTGKTRKAHELAPELFIVPVGSGHTIWFDGYVGQDAILIDDFYGGAIKYPFLLRMLDGYRFSLPVKGGFAWKSWTRVFITSNKSPEEWYPDGLTPALRRRITKITEFKKLDMPGSA